MTTRHVRLARHRFQAEKDGAVRRVITVNPMQPRPDRLAAACESLDSGGIAALPTETFYGLAADCQNPVALREVNRIKRKADDAPLLLLMAEPAQVELVAAERPRHFEELAKLFWPGPLTLVVPAASDLPSEVSGGRGTVAVRVPGLALPRRLARELGRPITGVSANVHGEPPARTAADVARIFPEGVTLILDGGPTQGGAPSTILDLTTERPTVLREGILPRTALEVYLPDLVPAGS
jgi:L-threonylcarbamoyladenylate synthase